MAKTVAKKVASRPGVEVALNKRRRSLPQSTLDKVFMEAGYMCANPRCRMIIVLEAHHIIWVKDGGGDDPFNLLALCPNCHQLHTIGKISHDAIRHWKRMLVALNHAFDRRSMELLIFTHRMTGRRLYYSGDGLLSFAGLIATGLVELEASQATEEISVEYADEADHTSRYPTGVFTRATYRVKLSEKGRMLVEAWLSEDGEKYRQLVNLRWDDDKPS